MAGGGIVLVPWYATVFRANAFEEALAEIAPIAMRYGALEYELLRSREDGYNFKQFSRFEDKLDFERYWYGPEFERWRAEHTGWYQVPIVYQWHSRVDRGEATIATLAAERGHDD